MASHSHVSLTPEAYLELERAAEQKHEYIEGAMVAMAGGSLIHSLIAANCTILLGNALEGKGCYTFNSGCRVCVQWNRLITYPDVIALCGEPEFVGQRRDTLLNPTVIIEVLSPSTRSYDRGDKARLYRLMPSLQEFLLIEQTPVDIDHYRRLPDGTWQISAHTAVDTRIDLPSVGASLEAKRIYRGVEEFL